MSRAITVTLSRSREIELVMDDIVRPATDRPRALLGVTFEVRTADDATQLVAPQAGLIDTEVPGGYVARVPAITGTH